MLEYSLIKQHRPAVQHPPARRQELSVPGHHPRRGVAAGPGHAGPQAQGRALLRSLRPRLRHPGHARPAAAHLPDPHLLAEQVPDARAARPALPAVPHREVLGARASARSTRPRYDELVDELIDFLDGDTDGIVAEARRREMKGAAGELEFERAARLRDRLTAVHKAIETPADGGRPQRGHRRDRPGRRRPRGRGAGVLRAQGAGRRAQGLHRRQGRGPHARLVSWPASSRSSTARSRRSACPSRCWCPVEPESVAVYEEWLSRAAAARGSQVRVPQRGDKRELQETVTRNAKEEFTRHRLRRASRPQQPGPGAQRAAGRARPARGPAADRVLRHEPHPGHRLRRARWW